MNLAIDQLEFIGGALCLDFTNTVGGTREEPVEKIPDYTTLLRWGERVGMLDAGEAAELRGRAESDPESGQRAYERAIELREAIFRIFQAVLQDRPADPWDLGRLNEHLGPAMERLRVASASGGYGWSVEISRMPLDGICGPIVRDAAHLLVEGDLERVKECGGEDCGWLFLDASRNRSRRWCDMSDCGNRAKARRHYRRSRASRP